MKRFFALMSVALVLSVTTFSHQLFAISDACTDAEICLVTSPSQNTFTVTCAPCTNFPGLNCVTITQALACPIHYAADCNDFFTTLVNNPLAFPRFPPVPNVQDCCIYNNSITFPISGSCPP